LPGALDLFFDYGAVGDGLDGTEVYAPDLPGASGSPIFEVQSPRSLWMPPRIVAVQASFLKGKYFRGTDWRVVAKLLSMVDPQLHDEITKRFGPLT
jgi:hypothetical protein